MISGQTIENESLKLTVNHNGTLSIFDKSLNKVFKDLLVFEDTGDIGNEYIYFQPKNTKPILSTDSPEKALISFKNNFTFTNRFM